MAIGAESTNSNTRPMTGASSRNPRSRDATTIAGKDCKPLQASATPGEAFARWMTLPSRWIDTPSICARWVAAGEPSPCNEDDADLAQRLGVPNYRDGNVIHLANTSLGVAEACSGNT